MTQEQYKAAQDIEVNIQKITDIEYDISSSSAFRRLPDDLSLKLVEFTQSLKDELKQKFCEL